MCLCLLVVCLFVCLSARLFAWLVVCLLVGVIVCLFCESVCFVSLFVCPCATVRTCVDCLFVRPPCLFCICVAQSLRPFAFSHLCCYVFALLVCLLFVCWVLVSKLVS